MPAQLALIDTTDLALERVTTSPDRNPAAVYLARLGTGSRRTMRQALETIASLVSSGKLDAATFPWHALRYPHTAAVRAVLAERYRPATANKMIAALRGVLREAFRLGLMAAEEFHRTADIPTIRAQTLPRGRALAAGELAGLMAACGQDASPAGRRDAALIAVLYGGGLRRSEAVGLDVNDYHPETGELVIHGGKGRKDRLTYATNGAADAIGDWLDTRGREPGPLFTHIHRGSHVCLRRLTDQAVLHILQKRAVEAGVSQFSPHDLRRSFISDLLDAGADIATAQRLAGHANVQTTVRYDRRGEAAKRKATELLHVPFFRARQGRGSPSNAPNKR